jgi:hypothetical protein
MGDVVLPREGARPAYELTKLLLDPVVRNGLAGVFPLGERFIGRRSGQPKQLRSRTHVCASQPAVESRTACPPNIGLLRSQRLCGLLFYKHWAPKEPGRLDGPAACRSSWSACDTQLAALSPPFSRADRASRRGVTPTAPGGTSKAFTLAVLIALLLMTPVCGRRPAARPGLVVTDEIGRRVSVPAQPQRLISLAPSVTEILFALGLGGRVVGVTSYCDYPSEATSIEKVGDTQRPSLERIVGLKPDLVIVSTASQLEEFVRKLDEVGIAIYVSNPRDIEDCSALSNESAK